MSYKEERTVEHDAYVASCVANGMWVCRRCGWWDFKHANHTCDPKTGAAASALMERLPNVFSSKLGHGDQVVSFSFAEGRALSLRCERGGRAFVVGDLHWLDSLSEEQAARLLRLLGDFSKSLDEDASRRERGP